MFPFFHRCCEFLFSSSGQGRRFLCQVLPRGIVVRAMADHRPCRPGVAVRHLHADRLHRLPLHATGRSGKMPAAVSQTVAQHGDPPFAQQRPQCRVALLGDASQPLLSAGGQLPGNQSQAGRELAPVAIRRTVAEHGGKVGGGEHPDSGYLLQPLARFALPVPRADPRMQIGGGLRQPIDRSKNLSLALPQRRRKIVAVLLQLAGQPLESLRPRTLDQAELGAGGSHVIPAHRALLDQRAPRPMHRQQRRRAFALQRRVPHVRTLRRLADRLGVQRVVLLALDVRLHVRRRNQARVVALLLDLAAPPVRSRAGLHRHHAGSELGEIRQNLASPQRLRFNKPAFPVGAEHVERILRQIQPHSFYNVVHGCLPSLLVKKQ